MERVSRIRLVSITFVTGLHLVSISGGRVLVDLSG